MNTYIQRRKFSLTFRILTWFVISAFTGTMLFPPNAQAQTNYIATLPVPGTMVPVSTPYAPTLIKGIQLYPDDPLRFNFILDTGDSELEGEALEDETQKLISYFLASLAVPKSDMWVNLSPYEQNKIIEETFGQTTMGRDLLAQDYVLKQLTASVIYPEDELGKEFWQTVYAKAQELYGTTELPFNTFNKVWIVPERAEVYENTEQNATFITDTYLKVLLESDYLALKKNDANTDLGTDQLANNDLTDVNEFTSRIIKELVIPEIEREVNQGKHFAPLRQIYHSLILATWYKEALRESVLTKYYADQGKVDGIDVDDKEVNQKIYEQYIKAYQKGVYNFIKEEYDPVSQQLIPRKYFSGGVEATQTRVTSTGGPGAATAYFSRDGGYALTADAVLGNSGTGEEINLATGAIGSLPVIIDQGGSLKFVGPPLTEENLLPENRYLNEWSAEADLKKPSLHLINLPDGRILKFYGIVLENTNVEETGRTSHRFQIMKNGTPTWVVALNNTSNRDEKLFHELSEIKAEEIVINKLIERGQTIDDIGDLEFQKRVHVIASALQAFAFKRTGDGREAIDEVTPWHAEQITTMDDDALFDLFAEVDRREHWQIIYDHLGSDALLSALGYEERVHRAARQEIQARKLDLPLLGGVLDYSSVRQTMLVVAAMSIEAPEWQAWAEQILQSMDAEVAQVINGSYVPIVNRDATFSFAIFDMLIDGIITRIFPLDDFLTLAERDDLPTILARQLKIPERRDFIRNLLIQVLTTDQPTVVNPITGALEIENPYIDRISRLALRGGLTSDEVRRFTIDSLIASAPNGILPGPQLGFRPLVGALSTPGRGLFGNEIETIALALTPLYEAVRSGDLANDVDRFLSRAARTTRTRILPAGLAALAVIVVIDQLDLDFDFGWSLPFPVGMGLLDGDDVADNNKPSAAFYALEREIEEGQVEPGVEVARNPLVREGTVEIGASFLNQYFTSAEGSYDIDVAELTGPDDVTNLVGPPITDEFVIADPPPPWATITSGEFPGGVIYTGVYGGIHEGGYFQKEHTHTGSGSEVTFTFQQTIPGGIPPNTEMSLSAPAGYYASGLVNAESLPFNMNEGYNEIFGFANTEPQTFEVQYSPVETITSFEGTNSRVAREVNRLQTNPELADVWNDINQASSFEEVQNLLGKYFAYSPNVSVPRGISLYFDYLGNTLGQGNRLVVDEEGLVTYAFLFLEAFARSDRAKEIYPNGLDVFYTAGIPADSYSVTDGVIPNVGSKLHYINVHEYHNPPVVNDGVVQHDVRNDGLTQHLIPVGPELLIAYNIEDISYVVEQTEDAASEANDAAVDTEVESQLDEQRAAARDAETRQITIDAQEADLPRQFYQPRAGDSPTRVAARLINEPAIIAGEPNIKVWRVAQLIVNLTNAEYRKLLGRDILEPLGEEPSVDDYLLPLQIDGGPYYLALPSVKDIEESELLEEYDIPLDYDALQPQTFNQQNQIPTSHFARNEADGSQRRTGWLMTLAGFFFPAPKSNSSQQQRSGGAVTLYSNPFGSFLGIVIGVYLLILASAHFTPKLWKAFFHDVPVVLAIVDFWTGSDLLPEKYKKKEPLRSNLFVDRTPPASLNKPDNVAGNLLEMNPAGADNNLAVFTEGALPKQDLPPLLIASRHSGVTRSGDVSLETDYKVGFPPQTEGQAAQASFVQTQTFNTTIEAIVLPSFPGYQAVDINEDAKEHFRFNQKEGTIRSWQESTRPIPVEVTYAPVTEFTDTSAATTDFNRRMTLEFANLESAENLSGLAASIKAAQNVNDILVALSEHVEFNPLVGNHFSSSYFSTLAQRQSYDPKLALNAEDLAVLIRTALEYYKANLAEDQRTMSYAFISGFPNYEITDDNQIRTPKKESFVEIVSSPGAVTGPSGQRFVLDQPTEAQYIQINENIFSGNANVLTMNLGGEVLSNTLITGRVEEPTPEPVEAVLRGVLISNSPWGDKVQFQASAAASPKAAVILGEVDYGEAEIDEGLPIFTSGAHHNMNAFTDFTPSQRVAQVGEAEFGLQWTIPASADVNTVIAVPHVQGYRATGLQEVPVDAQNRPLVEFVLDQQVLRNPAGIDPLNVVVEYTSDYAIRYAEPTIGNVNDDQEFLEMNSIKTLEGLAGLYSDIQAADSVEDVLKLMPKYLILNEESNRVFTQGDRYADILVDSLIVPGRKMVVNRLEAAKIAYIWIKLFLEENPPILETQVEYKGGYASWNVNEDNQLLASDATDWVVVTQIDPYYSEDLNEGELRERSLTQTLHSPVDYLARPIYTPGSEPKTILGFTRELLNQNQDVTDEQVYGVANLIVQLTNNHHPGRLNLETILSSGVEDIVIRDRATSNPLALVAPNSADLSAIGFGNLKLNTNMKGLIFIGLSIAGLGGAFLGGGQTGRREPEPGEGEDQNGKPGSPDRKGGIDLEAVSVGVQSSGQGVQPTAADPAQLEQLINAPGLTPMIKGIQLMPLPTLNLLIGANDQDTDSSPDSQQAQGDSYDQAAFLRNDQQLGKPSI